MQFSVEHVIQIWNDKTGDRVELKPDGDGLGLWQIRNVSDDGKPNDGVTMDREAAILLFREGLKLLEAIAEKEGA